ncbi:flavin reductase family protein [Simiduia aestuariiviva]|uniref:3-hydroxy-9,10-secoandrosta-1,3,5(10)-triene-9, 17-dione monooxygenase reductase component n=1 Tax=Simiduia aestuariiviva TaxID=1510459 RepID=A0A839USF1_9GAMM|nr:flavin reductase [Simiduia aestuariiviva]MBB3169379.1 3-hydroxy-9,10-secoandrosta-1,3,5(10)-triene-9,17-dione monooxygenase reductase component [Simiduia aestuariiviva]
MSTAPRPFDSLAFRNALGSFPTGVTIVTTRDEQGQPVGMTVSSFNSVSLEPPLVLWSIAKTANCFDVFERTDHFAIHVLKEDQHALSDLFGRPSPDDKFDQLPLANGVANSPILPDCGAVFECTLEHRYAGGDHIILVGRVQQFAVSAGNPLVFHAGLYRGLK